MLKGSQRDVQSDSHAGEVDSSLPLLEGELARLHAEISKLLSSS